MLESLRETNIHTLNLSEQASLPYLDFGPVESFVNSNLDSAVEEAEIMFHDNHFFEFLEISAGLAVVNPSGFAQLKSKWEHWKDLGFDVWEKIAKYHARFPEYGNIKIIYPERFGERYGSFDQRMFLEGVNNFVSRNKFGIAADVDWIEFVTSMTSLRIAFNLDPLKDSTFDGGFLSEITNNIQEERKTQISSFPDYMVMLKMVFPQYFNKFGVTKKDWDLMLQGIYKMANNDNWTGVLMYAKGMKILAAKEVLVTGQGLDFIMPEPDLHPDPIPDLPEVRKF